MWQDGTLNRTQINFKNVTSRDKLKSISLPRKQTQLQFHSRSSNGVQQCEHPTMVKKFFHATSFFGLWTLTQGTCVNKLQLIIYLEYANRTSIIIKGRVQIFMKVMLLYSTVKVFIPCSTTRTPYLGYNLTLTVCIYCLFMNVYALVHILYGRS